MKIKDMVGITIGSVLVGQALHSIGNNMAGGLGRATQTLVGAGFLGHTAAKVKKDLED